MGKKVTRMTDTALLDLGTGKDPKAHLEDVDKKCSWQQKCGRNERFSCDMCDKLQRQINHGRALKVPGHMKHCQHLRDSCCKKWNYTWLVVLLSVVIGIMGIALLVTIAKGMRRKSAAHDDNDALMPTLIRVPAL